jgi:hypothetical protein
MNEVTFMKRNSQTPIINAVVNDNNLDEYYPITEEEQQIIILTIRRSVRQTAPSIL